MIKTNRKARVIAPHSGTSLPAGGDDLARLLPLWPHELSDGSKAGVEKRLALLQRALRAERLRGRSGDWTYDLARHAALLRVYQQHCLQLSELKSR